MQDDVVAVGGTSPSAGHLMLIHDLAEPDVRIESIDPLTSHLVATNEHIFRILHSEPDDESGSELLVYDRVGVAMYRRIRGLSDPHAFVWNGQHLVVPNTRYNQILWLTAEGATERVWQAPTAAEDCWHINGVTMKDGNVVASAFGRFPSPADLIAGPLAGRGIVFDPLSGSDLMTELTCPHDPLFIDNGWFVCDSKPGRILHIDATSGRRLVIDLGRWTRGVAVDERRLYVGLSAQRYDANDNEGALAVIDRRTWSVERIIPLPCKEVNSVALIPRDLIGGLRRGLRTNAHRVRVQDAVELHRIVGSIHPRGEMTTMRSLSPDECDIDVEATMPRTGSVNQTVEVEVTITNHGPHTLISAPPHPVHLGYRISTSDGTLVGQLDERRTVLCDPVPPGGSLAISVPIVLPDRPGEYRVSFTLVQESIRWFDEVRPENAAHATIWVGSKRAAIPPDAPTVRGDDVSNSGTRRSPSKSPVESSS